VVHNPSHIPRVRPGRLAGRAPLDYRLSSASNSFERLTDANGEVKSTIILKLCLRLMCLADVFGGG